MTTRRSILKGGLAAAALTSAPSIITSKAQPSAARTVKAVMHADLRVLDPIWTTANISAYHGAMIYDTLFGLDANFKPQPQMVGKWGVSDDKLTYTFELRDGLKFSDGAPVTAADCVASVRRWAARAAAGQTMMQRVKDTPVVDDKTFRIVLSEPYGLVIDSLSTISTSLCYMMRKKDADTDPNQQVRETIGSGPFLYNRDETRPGNRHVYDRNPNYVPRSEPASAMSGGKVVKLDRVTFENIADEQTALSALQAGEIDFYEVPPQDLIDDLKKDRNLTVEVLNKTGHIAFMRLNHLHPPFNNPDAPQGDAPPRQAGRRDARDLRADLEVMAGLRLVLRLRHADDQRREHRVVQGRARASPRRRSCSPRPATTASRWSCCRRPTTISPIRPACSPRNGCARPASTSISPRWTGAR